MSDPTDELGDMVHADSRTARAFTVADFARLSRALGPPVHTPTVWVTEGNWARFQRTLVAEGVRNAGGPVNRDIFGGVPVRELGKGELPRKGDFVFDGVGFLLIEVDPAPAVRRLLPGSVA